MFCLAAEPARIVTLTTGDSNNATQQAVASLLKRLPNAVIQTPAEIAVARRRTAIHIAIGPAAFKSLLAARVNGPIVSLFTSNLVYRELIAERLSDAPVTAIFSDPSPTEQMRLIHAIYKRPVSVVSLIQSADYIPELKRAAHLTSTDLTIETVAPDDNIFRLVNQIPSQSALLALPEAKIYNAETLRNLLIATYRRELAVIGFSSAFVKAGALAGAISDSDDIAGQVEELLDEFDRTGRLPSAAHPKYFSIVVNDSVARSLNLVIDESVRQLSRKPKARP
jgi:ABC-type uncharacterized transport system substrate-binding protein